MGVSTPPKMPGETVMGFLGRSPVSFRCLPTGSVQRCWPVVGAVRVDLAHLAGDELDLGLDALDRDRRSDRVHLQVVIAQVVRNYLAEPEQLPRLAVEGDERVRVEIRTGATRPVRELRGSIKRRRIGDG
jgi:hypothetical protein